MTSDLPKRTFVFAVRIVKLWKRLINRRNVPRNLLNQFLSSGTSVGAQIEEGVASESIADFVHKYSIACKEARETKYWLRLMVATDVISEEDLSDLIDENSQIIAILTTTIKKLKQKK